jgi:hypothetical protein
MYNLTEGHNYYQGGSLDAVNICGADAARSLAAQVTLIVEPVEKH